MSSDPDALLEVWRGLGPAQTVTLPAAPAPSVLSRAGLREAAVEANEVVVEAMPSWLLPPHHPQLHLPTAPAIVARPTRRFELWDPGGRFDGAAFEALVARRRDRSWWLAEAPALTTRLFERLQGAAGLRRAVHRITKARGLEVRSIVLTGNTLWGAEPTSTFDVAAIVAGRHLTHEMSVPLEADEIFSVAETPVTHLDLLTLGVAALERPRELEGTLGPWRLPDGRPFPYDLRRRTVVSAVRVTFAAGLVVHGEDLLGDEPLDPRALAGLAYYFTQEASALLGLRVDGAKAAKRLLEAQLILALLGDHDAQAIAQARAALTRLSEDPGHAATWAALQGWWGREGLLDRTVRALVRAARGRGEALRAPQLGRAVRRAQRTSPPAWSRLEARFEQLVYRDAIAALLAGQDVRRIATFARDPRRRAPRTREASLPALLAAVEALAPTLPSRRGEPHDVHARSLELCALGRAFLAGAPWWYWLSEPLALLDGRC